MKSPCRNLAVLLLFASPLLHSCLYTHAASSSPPVTRPRIIFMADAGPDDNYDDGDDDYLDNHSSPPEVYPRQTSVLQQAPELCQYNPCLENQEPCAQLSKKTGCLCPGVSGDDESPHPPRIQMLLPVSEGDDTGKIEVQWCAPSSVVSTYRIVIEGSEGHPQEFKNVSRRGVVGSLEVGTKVCVEAVNSAGHSTPSEFSCKRYDPPKSSNHNLLAWIIGGGIALLLVIIIAAVLLWKYQMHQKAKKDSTDGLGNPSYSKEGTL